MKQDYIYCPLCGTIIYSELGEQNLNKLEGLWQCTECHYDISISKIQKVI